MPNAIGTITVIITAYNQGRFLARSLKSVFSQIRKPTEIIVVDDGSTDNTPKVLEDFKENLSPEDGKKLKYIIHGRNLGPLPTFNEGLKATKGDYVIFLPADDWFAPSILAEEAEILDRNPKIGVVYSQAITVRDGVEELKVAKPAGSETAIGRNEFERLLTQGDFVPLLTALFRRTAYEKLGGWDENLRFHADHEFWIRLAKIYPFAYLAKPLAYYRVHKEADHLRPEFLTSFEREFNYILKKHLPENDQALKKIRMKAYCYYYQRLFTEKVLAGEFGQAWKFWLRSFLIMPTFSHLATWRPFAWFLKKKIASFFILSES